jgi:iron complex outermembrane receptor protein
VSLSVSYPFAPTKWWNVYANATAYHKYNEADFGGNKLIDISANVFSFYAQNTFSLPGDFKLEVSGWYNSPALWGGNFQTDAMWSMDIGVQKKIFGDRGNIKLSVSDPFLTQRWRGYNTFGELFLDINGGNDTRRLRLNFSYLLGNNKVKQARNRKTGLEDEQSRIKSGG